MKKDIFITISVILSVLAVIAGFFGFLFWLFSGEPTAITGLDFSSPEIAFLTNNGFLEPQGKDAKFEDFNLKPLEFIEQRLNSADEKFEVLAAKLDNNSYQMAFRLENKTEQDKEFYLIPVSKESQLQFEEIKGVINDKNALSIKKEDAKTEPLSQLYDVKKHKKELKPELAKAYEDIKGNGYSAKPVKITLPPKSALLASSNWQITRDSPLQGTVPNDRLDPVYLLVYGSAGGAKDDLVILNVHSHPRQGDNWEVSFTTKGIADLKIIPNDQSTIDDDEFVSLLCNSEERTPQILQGDVIYYPSWECLGTGKVIHYTKKAGKHTLKFEFNNITVFAYNTSTGVFNVNGGLNVNDALSVKGELISAFVCGDTLTDTRDSKTYATVQIGSQCWMRENINVGTKITSCTGGYVGTCTTGGDTVQNQGTTCPSAAEIEKYCYSDSEANCTTYGGLYQWNQAMCGSTTAGVTGICPTGWHIPTHDEYTALERAVCTSGTCATDFPYDTSTADWRGTNEGTTLKTVDSTHFSGLFGGHRRADGSFIFLTSYAYFWSSVQSGNNAWYRAPRSSSATVSRFVDGKTLGYSIRCLKN